MFGTLYIFSRVYKVNVWTNRNGWLIKIIEAHACNMISFHCTDLKPLQGVTYPSIHAVWSKWAPPQEKTKLATLAFSGL